MAGLKRHKVVWSRIAASDLEAILDYIAADSPANASRILARITKTVARLRTLPNRGRIVPELRDQGISTYRELILRPWRIVYRVTGTQVHVMAVIDSRRNVEDLLLERFSRANE